jgi:ABC-type dipeptide/oligopeptide/nickel transport system permease component
MEIQNLKSRLRRLEIMFVIVLIMFGTSVGFSIYSAMQIRSVAGKIPSYQEIKKDIERLNDIYKISEQKVPQAYNYTKEKAAQGYNYSKEKANELLEYLKEKSKEKKK